MVNRKKVLLIGWDGADWKVINPLIEAGLMPNLEKMVNKGTIGNLATLDPPYSPMLWTSIATGKRPFKHGVLGFYEPDPDGKNVRPVLSISRKCKAIWNILTEKNYKTHVVGWWPSHPAEEINGIAISNLYQRAGNDNEENWSIPQYSVSPESQTQHFKKLRIHPSELTSAHILPFIPDLAKINRYGSKYIEPLVQILAENSSLHAAFTNIIRTQDWDFASVYFDMIDRVCHEFMKYHPPYRSHIPKDEFDLYKDVVKGIYRFSDMMLGRLMELADESTTIMIVSDHGFQPDSLRPRNIPHEPAGIAYEHSPYGIFCITGPGIKKDSLVHGAGVLDITPTILQLLDLPIGDDMDGTPLLSVFEQPTIPKTIPSWDFENEEKSKPTIDFTENQEFIDDMMQQLVELGYIEKPNEDKEKAFMDASRFCEINLARSYMDGGQVEEASKIFEKVYQENPNKPWVIYRLAICCQMLGDHNKCRNLIEILKTGHFYDLSFINLMEASILMAEGNYKASLDLLKSIENKVPEYTQNIYLKIGRCYSMLGKPEDAERALLKELSINFENPHAHQFLGAINFNQGKYEKAEENLLNSISLSYSLAESHFLLGRVLLSKGDYEAACDAFEVCLSIAPFNNHARQLLAYTYRSHLDNPAKSSMVLKDFNKYILGTIYIVSGFPRSGTSMMMQMLKQGGLSLFTDNARGSDENNPFGYFEHQIVKKIAHNTEWLKLARDKAVKIVAPLVTQLPFNYRYKIIFMERDVGEIYTSQKRMIHRMGGNSKMDTWSLGTIKSIENTISESKNWINQHPSSEILYVKYNEVLLNPLEHAIKISKFIGEQLNPIEMIKAVEPSLYREKSS